MKQISIYILIVLFVFPMRLFAQKNDPENENDVYKTIILLGNSWTKNNMDTLEKYIHPDYRHTDVRGQLLDRTSWLSFVKDRKDKGLTNPDLKFDDVIIKIYGDFALVTGINTIVGQTYTSNDNATDTPRKLRFTQVLKLENAVWKRIAFQATYSDPQ